jgi:uncharacterized membrane protein
MPVYTTALAISGDGTSLAGQMYVASAQNSHAYRRVGTGPLQDLGVLTGYTRGLASGISGDGSVVVGKYERGPLSQYDGQAFRWTAQGGVQGLGFLRPGGFFSQANAVSRDGSTIVGTSVDGSLSSEAFRWTAATGMQALPRLPGVGNVDSYARAVSVQGGFVAGDTDNAAGQHRAVLWSGGGVLDLGPVQHFPTFGTFASGVSDTGDVVVGFGTDNIIHLAFAWTPSTGIMTLSDYLAASGVQVPSGWTLERALTVSGDGLTIAGVASLTGQQRQGFVATIPAPSALLVLPLLLFSAARRKR